MGKAKDFLGLVKEAKLSPEDIKTLKWHGQGKEFYRRIYITAHSQKGPALWTEGFSGYFTFGNKECVIDGGDVKFKFFTNEVTDVNFGDRAGTVIVNDNVMIEFRTR